MIDRSIARASLIALIVAACSTTVAPTPTPPPATPVPTTAPTAAPTPTPGPTIDEQPLPTTSVFGWWEHSIKYGCHPPAYVRVDGVVHPLGVCPGALDDSPASFTVDVGQDFDIHMAVHYDGSPPIYPLPEPQDPLIARGWLIFDAATMTYRGLTPGTTRLMTTGSCWISDNSPTGVHDVDGPCPVLELHVRDIDITCLGVAADLCRASGATAALVAGTSEERGTIESWIVQPVSLKIEWPGCGHVVTKVTVTFRVPDHQATYTLGQPKPDTDPLQLAWCTY